MESNQMACCKAKIRYIYNSRDKRTPLKMNELQLDESILWLIIS